MIDPIIIGTLALDTVETPFGRKENILGGSGTYAALAASLFSTPGLVSVAGKDFPEEHLQLLMSKKIDLEGVERKGKTFRWEGFYKFDMNEAETKKTELNVLTEFDPKLPDSYRNATHFFLGNIDPRLQMKVIRQLKDPKMIILDTMNLWINTKKEQLIKTIKKVDVLLMNDGEARMLFDTPNLVKAANEGLQLGPEAVIIKKGEHGSLLFTKEKHFNAPGYPLENVRDPTGCGDSFGGALIGYLTKEGKMTDEVLRKGIVYGSVVASYNAEAFSVERLQKLTLNDVEKRFEEMRELREF